MSITHTGNAEIDQQHAILESMVEDLRNFCDIESTQADADCSNCSSKTRTDCTSTLERLNNQLGAFLTGHATYEERMMELLPDSPICQAHIKAHKAAHEGIARQLRQLGNKLGHDSPQIAGKALWQLIGNWLGNHATMFDHRLVRLGKSSAPEIDYDAELVAMLDQHVFPNRPTPTPTKHPAVQRQRLEIRGRFESLTQAQRKVFWLVVAGRRNSEIAEALGISINTVKTHRSAVFQKFEVDSVIELIQKTDMLR